MLVNRANLNDLFVAFNAAFKEGFGSYSADDLAPILMRTTAKTKEAHYAWLGQFPGLRKWLGERVIRQLKAHDYRIKNEPFESTVEVDSDDVMYDQVGIYSPLMTEMGRAAAAHPFELSFALLKAGFTTECYDGQYMFDTDHPVGREGQEVSVSNFQGGSGDPWFLVDASRAIKPLIFQEAKKPQFVAINQPTDESVFMTRMFKYGVDSRCNVGFGLWQLAYASKQTLNATNFNAAFAAMSEFKSDEGRPLGVRATHLYCKPSLREAALNIVKEYGTGGESNVNRNLVKVIDTPWLA